jgi:RNA polymerase sigma factor (sigma-70 family)
MRPFSHVVDDPVIETAGDELARVWREQAPRMWRALVAYTGEPAIASDALSEAFVQAFARGATLHRPDRWIWTAAFRIAAGELKERSKLSPEAERPMPDATEDAIELLEILHQLPPKQRASLVLHYYGGYRTKEIAAILGSSAATVRVHLSAGRKRLRQLLEADDA